MTHSPAAITGLPRALKIAAAATAVVAAIDIVATIAWTAGAPIAVLIPIWIALLLTATTVARRRRWLPRLERKR